MKTEDITLLFKGFENAASEIEGIECWSARELQVLLGYAKWENFEKVVNKAKEACANAGEEVQNHFPDVRKMVSREDTMATQIIKKDGLRVKPALPSGYTNAKVAGHVSASKSFVMPDLFLKQAEDVGKFLDKNPIPERD